MLAAVGPSLMTSTLPSSSAASCMPCGGGVEVADADELGDVDEGDRLPGHVGRIGRLTAVVLAAPRLPPAPAPRRRRAAGWWAGHHPRPSGPLGPGPTLSTAKVGASTSAVSRTIGLRMSLRLLFLYMNELCPARSVRWDRRRMRARVTSSRGHRSPRRPGSSRLSRSGGLRMSVLMSTARMRTTPTTIVVESPLAPAKREAVPQQLDEGEAEHRADDRAAAAEDAGAADDDRGDRGELEAGAHSPTGSCSRARRRPSRPGRT